MEPKPPGMLSIYNKSTYPEDRRLKVAAVISVLPGGLIILEVRVSMVQRLRRRRSKFYQRESKF